MRLRTFFSFEKFSGVIPPDSRYREGANPYRTLPQHCLRPCAWAHTPRMLRLPRIKPPPLPPRIWAGYIRACTITSFASQLRRKSLTKYWNATENRAVFRRQQGASVLCGGGWRDGARCRSKDRRSRCIHCCTVMSVIKSRNFVHCCNACLCLRSEGTGDRTVLERDRRTQQRNRSWRQRTR